MSKFQIVLADQDGDYISMLELRFLEHFGDVADIQLISDPAYFSSYFSTHRKLDLLILSESLYSSALARHHIGAIIRLSETPVAREGEPSATGEGVVLYKYNAMKSIFAEVAPYLRDNHAAESVGRGATQLISVYSPAGGMGATTIALGLAGALVRRNRRVLYLDTQPFQSSRRLLPPGELPNAGAQTELLTGGHALSQTLPNACGHALFDYVLPFDHAVTTYGVGLEHYRRLLRQVKAAAQYDFVVVDCSSEFTQEKSLLISECDRVVVVTGQDSAACWKTAALLQDINIPDKERFIFLCNRYQEDRPDHLKDTLPGKILIAGYLELLPEETCDDLEKLSAVPELDMLALRIL